ncbi:MarR family winged helix-turn-helix transcriptional regulator [Geodermatophilus sp. URMC 62]|uniref:MarR family winged helix-turn-helix transcriptional regulator n=1 Tax=Geodermatophilus sp. URMC 62 TaxID=3423414 RepID=UPI00406CB003
MDVVRLNALSRRLREVALAASRSSGDLDISVAQLAVIEAVARAPGSTVATITRTTGLAQSWVSRIVREMADAGVFVLAKDPDDRRRTRMSLSADAARLTFHDRGERSVDSGLAETASHLDEAGVRRVLDLLTELESLLRPDTGPDDGGDG